jgi:flavin-binding protein dodecin
MAKKSKGGSSRETNAVYKVIEIVGTSTESWADAARTGVETASKTLRDLRVAEVDKLDVKIEGGKLIYRAKMKVSFKYHGED